MENNCLVYTNSGRPGQYEQNCGIFSCCGKRDAIKHPRRYNHLIAYCTWNLDNINKSWHAYGTQNCMCFFITLLICYHLAHWHWGNWFSPQLNLKERGCLLKPFKIYTSFLFYNSNLLSLCPEVRCWCSIVGSCLFAFNFFSYNTFFVAFISFWIGACYFQHYDSWWNILGLSLIYLDAYYSSVIVNYNMFCIC